MFKKHTLLETVVNVLYLPDGHIKILRNLLIDMTVYVSSVQNATIPVMMDKLLYDILHLGVCVVVYPHIVTRISLRLPHNIIVCGA